jgi:hypothetical protein
MHIHHRIGASVSIHLATVHVSGTIVHCTAHSRLASVISIRSNLLFKRIFPVDERPSDAARHGEPLMIKGIEAPG